MKVSVTQSGGVLGAPAHFELDTDSLDESEAAALAAQSEDVTPAEAPPPTYPGELGYAVRIGNDDKPPVEASFTDSTLPDNVRALVNFVVDHPAVKRSLG